MIREHQQAAAAVITSGTSSAITFALVNEIAQFIASIVAIVSGVAAIYYYIKKARTK